MLDFWKVPEIGLDDLPTPGEDAKIQKAAQEAAKGAELPRTPPVVQWPPVKLLPDEGAPTSAPGEGRGRGARRKGGKDKDSGAAEKKSGDAKAVGPVGGQKREDGWLPKAEYEAKKREERARRQREREQEKGDSTASAGGKKVEDGKRGEKGRGSRAGGRGNWEDIIPKRPEPQEETAEAKDAREAEEARLACRDRLRGAATAAELRAAVEAARELGLTQEVSMGERKLAKMESA